MMFTQREKQVMNIFQALCVEHQKMHNDNGCDTCQFKADCDGLVKKVLLNSVIGVPVTDIQEQFRLRFGVVLTHAQGVKFTEYEGIPRATVTLKHGTKSYYKHNGSMWVQDNICPECQDAFLEDREGTDYCGKCGIYMDGGL